LVEEKLNSEQMSLFSY